MCRMSIKLMLTSVFAFGIAWFQPIDVKAEQATILLKLEPTRASGKKWDIGKGADPILCLNRTCLKSQGPNQRAKNYPGKTGLLPLVHAGSCRNKLACIYRKVEVPSGGAYVQPVDHDGINHDRGPLKFIKIDDSCKLRKNRLSCAQGVYTPEYSAWIIPESLVQKAGVRELQSALHKSIEDRKVEHMTETLRKKRRKLEETTARLFTLITGKDVPESCASNPDFINKAFQLSGLYNTPLNEQDRRLNRFIQNDRVAPILEEIKLQPRDFWALDKTLTTFENFASASLVQMLDGGNNMRLIRHGARTNKSSKTSLAVNQAIKAKASAILRDCSQAAEPVWLKL